MRCNLTPLKLADNCSNLKQIGSTEFAACLAYRCFRKCPAKQGVRVAGKYLPKGRLEVSVTLVSLLFCCTIPPILFPRESMQP